ncbi:hypothetical protein Bca4012_020561 [Brassica carinata]
MREKYKQEEENGAFDNGREAEHGSSEIFTFFRLRLHRVFPSSSTSNLSVVIFIKSCHRRLRRVPPSPSLNDGVELRSTRTITISGGSEYRIDNRVVNWEEYNGKIRSIGILVKACNFLRDVESVASKNLKEFTGLLEQISGSDELKKEYEELEEKKASAEEKKALIYQKKKTIGAEKKLKKSQKEEAEKHLNLQDELVTKSILALVSLVNIIDGIIVLNYQIFNHTHTHTFKMQNEKESGDGVSS